MSIRCAHQPNRVSQSQALKQCCNGFSRQSACIFTLVDRTDESSRLGLYRTQLLCKLRFQICWLWHDYASSRRCKSLYTRQRSKRSTGTKPYEKRTGLAHTRTSTVTSVTTVTRSPFPLLHQLIRERKQLIAHGVRDSTSLCPKT